MLFTMFNKLSAYVLLLAALAAASAFAQAPKMAPFQTAWGKKVASEDVHPEYPRPMMVRKEWLNLNGLWDWTESTPAAANPFLQSPAEKKVRKILVPFPPESTLSGIGRPAKRMEYRRRFTIPEHWPKDHRILLHFGAVDWETKVSLNGRPIGDGAEYHRGGYDSFSLDITEGLNADGPNELALEIFDPTDHGGQPRGRQSTTPSGVWYSASSGIWQTVWLEPVPKDFLRSVRYHADIETGTGTAEKRGGSGYAHLRLAGRTRRWRSRLLFQDR